MVKQTKFLRNGSYWDGQVDSSCAKFDGGIHFHKASQRPELDCVQKGIRQFNRDRTISDNKALSPAQEKLKATLKRQDSGLNRPSASSSMAILCSYIPFLQTSSSSEKPSTDAWTPQLIKCSWKPCGSQTGIAAWELRYFKTFISPSDTTKNTTCFSHCWEGFIPNAETASLSQINGKTAVSILLPYLRLLDTTKASWICKLTCYCGSKPSFVCNKEHVIVAANQNIRAAVSSWSNYTLT